MMEIDDIDTKILRAVIKDARVKLVDVAEDCGLSSTAIKDRITRMKKRGVIVKAALSINMSSLGYPLPVFIGVSLEYKKDCNQEDQIIELVEQHTKVAGIDHTIGKYDLCLFVFAKNVGELDKLKKLIRTHEGIRGIEMNIWNKFHLNYNNLEILNRGAELFGQN